MSHMHDPAPSDRARQFIRWCAEHILEWPEQYVSCARFIGSKNKWWRKNIDWREHHKSLSPNLWVVCTKRQWLEARGTR